MDRFVAGSALSVFRRFCSSSAALTLALLLLPSLSAYAQIVDNFNDNDDQSPVGETWTHFDPAGLGSWASSGGTYRLSSVGTTNVAVLGSSRASSYRPESVFADFSVSVDILDWDNAANPLMLFFVGARLSDFGAVASDGYALAVINGNGPVLPTLYLVRGDGVFPAVILTSVPIPTLAPSTEDYRLIFQGEGSLLYGALYALSNLSTPIGEVAEFDATYPSGATGIGVHDGTYPSVNPFESFPTDATFDNFSATGTASTFDIDADGLADNVELTLGTNPFVPDTDGDGLNDGAEVNTHLTNPLVVDTDSDGLSDGAEVNTYFTNPLVADMDGDGLTDGAELLTHLTNHLVADTDGDGFTDGVEVVSRANPLSNVVTPPRLGFSRLDGGTGFSCGIVRNGEILCWGDAAGGRLNAPGGTFRSLGLGGSFGCALRSDNSVACWGTGSAASPTPGSYVQLAAGVEHACGLRSDLMIACWGDNTRGQLVGIPSGRFSKIFAGDDHTCALDATGAPVCWGSNSDLQIEPPPGEVFASLTAGMSHTCGMHPEGSAVCWGSDASGQSDAPADSFTSLSAGSTHTCGLRSDGTALCWGSLETVPVSAPPFTYSSLASGNAHACGIKTGGTGLLDVVQCWGANGFGQGAPPGVTLPDVTNGFSSSCALAPDRRIRCWGSNGSGEATPPTTADFVAVNAGFTYACGLKQDGSVDCFGSNQNGRAVDQPAAGNPFVQVDLGGSHTCGLRLNGAVTCWGSNAVLQSTPDAGLYQQISASGPSTASTLGFACGVKVDGTIGCWGANNLGQTTEPAGATWQQVSAGQDFACALRTDGTVGCWGRNDFGQAPASVAGIFAQVAAGGNHACGLKPDGTVECWGNNLSGQGNAPPGRYSRISIGDNGGYTCGVQSPSGAIVCWGNPLGNLSPPLDLDDDNIEDGGDNCPGFANVLQADSDVDGAGDGCDVSPGFPDPDQIDRDGDGVGDAKDNCVEVHNPNQLDLDEDGVGDACVVTAVILQHVATSGFAALSGSPPPPPGGPVGDSSFDVYVYCPTVAIEKVELGVMLPQNTDPLTVSFGPGCEPTTCVNALVDPNTGLGATVNKDTSFALPPTSTPVPGVRADTLYFSLRGQGGTDNHLCSLPANPADPPVQQRVARITISEAPPDATLNLTTEGLSAQEPPMVPLSDTSDRILEPVEYSFIEVDQTPTVFLRLAPAAGDTSKRRWQVELETDAVTELSRVTFGLTIPTTITPTPTLTFLGCTQNASSPPATATTRNCATSDPPNPWLGPYVQTGSTSFTVGPQAPPNLGLRTDTLYVSVAGARDGEFGVASQALNIPGQPVLLGVVELTSTLPPSVVLDPPTLTLEGVGTTTVFIDGAYVNTSDDPVSTDFVSREAGYNQPSDSDADSRSDDLDNCPYTPNVTQSNAGGFLTTIPDLFGDLCQCADLGGDGAVCKDGADCALDTLKLREALTGQATAAVLGRCSVAGGPECDIRDYVIFRRAVESLPGPGISSVCASAVRSVQLP